MNPTLLIQSILKTLNLVLRLAEASGMEDEALREYVEARNRLRKQLVQRSEELANDDPEQGDIERALTEIGHVPEPEQGDIERALTEIGYVPEPEVDDPAVVNTTPATTETEGHATSTPAQPE